MAWCRCHLSACRRYLSGCLDERFNLSLTQRVGHVGVFGMRGPDPFGKERLRLENVANPFAVPFIDWIERNCSVQIPESVHNLLPFEEPEFIAVVAVVIRHVF